MKADGSLALISYRLERSRESLRAAEIMIMGTGLNLSPLSKRIYNETFAQPTSRHCEALMRRGNLSDHGDL